MGKLWGFVVNSGNGGEKERGSRIEIGRDTGAIFSDLNFRFLLMHYNIGNPKSNPIQFQSKRGLISLQLNCSNSRNSK